MKILKTIEEVKEEGLLALIGKRVTLFCDTYIYTGDLIGVNADCVKLSKAGVVYETGPFTDKAWKDFQPLPNDWYVMLNKIESFGELKQ